MFRDKNNAPIKADSVHVKGSIFTGSGKPFEFEVIINFKEMVGMPFIPDELEKGATEFYE